MYCKWKNLFLASRWSLSHLRSVFLDRVIHFRGNLVDQVKDRSLKGKKIVVKSSPCSALESTGRIWTLSFLHWVFLDQVIHFGKYLGDQEKGRSPKKVKPLIEVPYVVHVKVHVLGSYTKKAKVVDRVSLCCAHVLICSNLHSEPFLFSAACSPTEFSL